MRRIPFLTATEIQGKQEPPLTQEQIEAKYSSGQNILVSASAGSGKTYVMTQRILDQLSRGVEINQLFISTFTVKAATELKERLEKEISKEIKASDNVELKQHLSKQLADLPSATIGTMDAFTKNFLEKHGYLINISPNFRILQDENEQLILKNEVFHQVFERFYNGSNQKMFSKLVKNFAGKGKTERGFRQVVYQIYDFLQSTSDPQEWLEKTFLKGMKNINFDSSKSELIDTVKKALKEFGEFLKYHLDNEAPLFPTAKYVQNIQPVIDEIDSLTPQASFETVVKILERVLTKVNESRGRALSHSGRGELKAIGKAYNAERTKQCDNLKDLAEQLDLLLYQDYYHQEIVELAEVLQEFMNDFVSSYRQRKREENAFEFADISHFTIEILETFDDIRESYQNHFYEVMVDEYQDTNHIQERMLELLSNGHNRFMVGDIKQSIYRFRQADPQIFREKFQAYNQNPEEGKLILLKENFRSGPEVLSATNDIFQHLMDDEVGEITYDDMHKLVYPHPNNSYDKSNETEIILYDKNASKRDDNEETAESEKQSYYKLVASEVLSLKEKIKNDIKHLEDELKTKDEDDDRAKEIKKELSKLTNHPITLLVSSRTNYDEIIQVFSEFGLSVDPDGGQQTYLKSLEVQVMLETLRVINNPLQDYSLVALLKSPMFRFDEDELTRFSLQSSKENSKENFYTKLLNAINKQGQHQELMTAPLYQKLELFLNQLEEWRLYAKTHSLYDLIWKIYNDRFYYDYVGALPNGQTRQANLYALALRAHQFEKTNVKGLHRFIRMIDQVLENDKDLDDVPVEVSEDSIRLMTIHKSKGLEFPYVFILDIDKEFNEQDSRSPIILSRKNGLGFKYIARVFQTGEDDTSTLSRLKVSIPSKTYKQNESELKLANHSEQMRLLYVAMTRAEKKLYLVGKASQENLEKREYTDSNSEFLTKQTRLNSKSFNDWIWAIRQVFASEKLRFSYRFVGEDSLSDNLLDNLENKTLLQEDSQANNRQSETIRAALDMLKSVEDFNDKHRASIDLPSVITPSQLKKQAQPHSNTDETNTTSTESQSLFELPDFSSDYEISGAEIGSATHELMECLDLTSKPTLESLTETLNQLPVREVVRKNVQLTRILTFFDTELGQEVLQNVDKLHREQSFSMLREDEESEEKYLVRGILDGYILYDDKIVLFDYKTDRYEHSDELVERYSGQLSLYEEALSKAYQISKIEKYLILFGKDEIEVVKLEE